MCLGDKYYNEDCLYCADGAEEQKEPGVPHQVNDRTGGLHGYEDHQELEGDDGAAHQRLQV